MTIYPAAKVNIHLEVRGKRRDGYHDLCSIFLRLKLCDQLTIDFNATKFFSLLYSKPVKWAIHQDLLYKSYQLLQKGMVSPFSVRLKLTKNIPDKAGLGGGSSDSAALLLAINRQFNLLDSSQLREIGKKIGSDLPFFLSEYAAAIVEATGDEIMEIPFVKLYIVLLKPVEEISTKEAFLALNSRDFSFNGSKDQLLNSWLDQKFNFSNIFAKVLADKYPFIQLYKEKLYHQGAQFAELSGTGSVVAGYFLHYDDACKAYHNLKGTVYCALLTETM